jgi:hypothetical protein
VPELGTLIGGNSAMPQLAHNGQGKSHRQKRINFALVVLLVGMTIVLAIWLYWSAKKKEQYRKTDPSAGRAEPGIAGQEWCIKFHKLFRKCSLMSTPDRRLA